MWVFLAIAGSFFHSIKYLLGKQIGRKDDHYYILWSQWFYGLFILIPLFLFFRQVRVLPSFWPVIILNGFIALLANSLFWKGLKDSDISLAIPLTALVPFFTLFFAPILIHQYPTFWGFAGIIITVIGTYLLNFSKSLNEIFSPFVQIWQNKGLLMILGASAIWGLTSVIDKVAIDLSSPISYLVFSYAVNALLVYLFVNLSKRKVNLFKANKYSIGVGVASGVAHSAQMYAISMFQVPYVIAVMNIGVLFSVMWGRFFLNEKAFLQRFIGAFIMFVGVTIIILLG